MTPAWQRVSASRSISVALDADVTFDVLESLGQPRPSQWTRVWPASVAVSRWLLAQVPGSLPDTATELGCGMGLVSVTLAHLGLVTESTDREPQALAFTLRNVLRNRLFGVTARHLDWSEPVGVPGPFVVAADVLYDAGTPALLFALIDGTTLLSPQGRFVLGVPEARAGLANELVARLVDAGYVTVDERSEVAWEGRVEAVVVHVLTRPA